MDDSSHMNLQQLPAQPAARDRGAAGRLSRRGSHINTIAELEPYSVVHHGINQVPKSDLGRVSRAPCEYNGAQLYER